MPGIRSTHQVKIGDDYFLLRGGTYRKRPAPMFGARYTTGDPDYNNLSAWQYWVQRCWIGGLGAEDWQDDAMYDYAIGVDTSQHEVAMLSRDMALTGNGDLNNEPSVRRFIEYNGEMYVLSLGGVSSPPGRLFRFNRGVSQQWDHVHEFNDRVRSIEVFNGKLFIGDLGDTLIYYNGTSMTHIDKPAVVGETVPYAMKVFGDKLYVAFGNQVWRLKKDLTWDGSTAFYAAEGVNYITDMEIHLGFLYMVSQNGHILRTDGNNTFDLWAFETGYVVTSIRSFDGRLFIAVNEGLDGTTAQQGVLYQFSGAAVTELQRWGKAGQDISLGKMRVVGHRLMMGGGGLLGHGNGFGVVAYDPREDGYHIWSTNRDTVTYAGSTEGIYWTVDDVILWKGSVWMSVYGHGIFRTPFSYRDASRFLATYDTTAAGASTAAGNGGILVSSDFDAGTPGLLKDWNAITFEYDLPHSSTSITPEYSLDGGQTWTALAALTKGADTRYTTSVFLPADTRGARFKWRVTLRTTNTAYSPFLRGVSVRYLPIPEPNWVWEMHLVLSDRQELLDKTVEAPDSAAKLATLRSAFRGQNLTTFTEPDGTEWAAVRIDAMSEFIPNIGHTDGGALEYEIQISLMEMVDEYPA